MERTTWIMAIMHMQIKESTIGSSTLKKTKTKNIWIIFITHSFMLTRLTRYDTFNIRFFFSILIFYLKRSSCFCSVLNLPFFTGFQWSVQWNIIIHVVNEQRTEKTMTRTHRRLCGFTLQLFLLAKLSKNNKKKKENEKKKQVSRQ